MHVKLFHGKGNHIIEPLCQKGNRIVWYRSGSGQDASSRFQWAV